MPSRVKLSRAMQVLGHLHAPLPTSQMRGVGVPSSSHCMRMQSTSVFAGKSGAWSSSSPRTQPTLHMSMASSYTCRVRARASA